MLVSVALVLEHARHGDPGEVIHDLIEPVGFDACSQDNGQHAGIVSDEIMRFQPRALRMQGDRGCVSADYYVVALHEDHFVGLVHSVKSTP